MEELFRKVVLVSRPHAQWKQRRVKPFDKLIGKGSTEIDLPSANEKSVAETAQILQALNYFRP